MHVHEIICPVLREAWVNKLSPTQDCTDDRNNKQSLELDTSEKSLEL